MPDSRIRLRHEGPSLLNVPTPVFQGPAHSLYGPRGPQRAAPDYGARKPLSGQPETVEHYIEDALARADLSARQRTALKGELMRTMHDIGFLRMLMADAKAKGPWSEAAVQDEGRPL
jgi:hypothetical protein